MIDIKKVEKFNRILKQRKKLMEQTLVVPVDKSAKKAYIKSLLGEED